MFTRTIIAMLCLGSNSGLGAEPPKPVTPVKAIEQIGKPEVLVEIVVKKAKDRLEKCGIIYLDSEDDFKDAKNLGVAISAARFVGKTIRVKGCVMRFEDRPYLPVHDPGQISVVEKK
ncbi:MAG: hypothetical protein ABSG53_08565 [Thermoguttaceae bacterium]|jgi:hypothetical protein